MKLSKGTISNDSPLVAFGESQISDSDWSKMSGKEKSEKNLLKKLSVTTDNRKKAKS